MRTRPGPIVYVPPGTAVSQISAKWDAGITSLVDLAAVATVDLVPPVIRAFVNSDTGAEEVWRLLVSTAETGDGVQRPTDYTAAAPKVWFKASS